VLAIWLAISMAVLDSSIANIALPTIAAQLQAPAALSIWVINAYQLAITALLLPLSALGDRIGYRRVYLPGLAIFIAGSAACAMAHSLATLIAARMFQGIGAAAIMSMNAALVRATYPQSKLGRGIGYNALVLSLSSAAGPSIAALILSVGSWPWLFLINVPIGLASLLIGRKSLPVTQGHGRKPDYVAAVLSAVTLGALVYGGETLARGEVGTGAPLLVIALVAGYVLVRREWHLEAPLLPLDLLRIPLLALSLATSVTTFAAQMCALVSLPFLLQNVLGRNVVESGRRHRAAGGPPGRASSRWRAGRDWPFHVCRWTVRPVAAGQRASHLGHPLAHSAVRRRIRLLSVAQQQDHPADCAKAPLRRRRGHAGHGPPAGSDHRSGGGGGGIPLAGSRFRTPAAAGCGIGRGAGGGVEPDAPES
jgi:MFS family permease